MIAQGTNERTVPTIHLKAHRPRRAAAVLCGVLMSTSMSASAAAETAPAGETPALAPPAEPLPDYDRLWRQAQPASPEELALWRTAVAALGSDAHAGCAYTRHTAPCPHCGDSRPRVYAEATQISLAANVPQLLALSVWYDTPVVHEAAKWVAERFNPRQTTTPWMLRSLDGKPPTRREFYDYEAEKSAAEGAWARAMRIAAEKNRALPPRFHPAQAVPLVAGLAPTVVLQADEAAMVLGRPPDRTASHPAARGMQTTYVIDSARPALTAIDQRILRPFRPHFGLRFRTFRQFAVLRWDATVGADVVAFQQQEFTGRLTLVFPFVQHRSEWFGEFDCPADGTTRGDL